MTTGLPVAPLPEVIGRRYALQELIGVGGMGAVYRAADRFTDHPVALKRVVTDREQLNLTESIDLEDFRLALAREFKLLASLRHPNVINVLDYGFDTSQQPYFTMELLENPATIIEAGRARSPENQVELLVQMLQALVYLHRRGILHRDLKPANVLVTDGVVKVLDFGLATMRGRVSDSEQFTAGTLAYMAPEVLMGHPASEASDLYAVGIIAFELFAGQLPFAETQDVSQLINSTLYGIPDTDSLDIHVELKLVIDRLLLKDPFARYATASEVLSALNAAANRPLLAETEATRESFLQAARLVGRSAELKQLSAALDQAVQGSGSVWLIAGESGVGKSRLVEELRTLALVEGALVMRGQAVNEGGSPYELWRLPMRWLVLIAETENIDASVVSALLPDLKVASPAAQPRSKSGDAQEKLVQLIETVLSQQSQPAVFLLEDLHWARSESLMILARLAERAQKLPLLIVASFRDDETPNLPETLPPLPLMKLNRLNDAEIAELSEAMLGEAGKQPHVLGLLQRETEGNVFFLIEVVRTLAEEAGQLDEIGRMTLPQHVFAGGVKRIVERRLTKIPAAGRNLLQVAAAIGRILDLPLLRTLEPALDLDRWLTDCADASVLEIFDEEWRFVHDKLRDGLLTHLSDSERRALHARVASAMERFFTGAAEQPATLAYHWGLAGDTAKELYYTERGAKHALVSGAYHEAIKLLRRGGELLKTREYVARTNPDEAQRHEARLRDLLAEAQSGLGNYDGAERLYRESLRAYEALGDRASTAHALTSLGEIAQAQDNPTGAKLLYEQSLAICRALNDLAGVARNLHGLGSIAFDQDNQEEAKRLYQESLNISRELGERRSRASTQDTAASSTEAYMAERQRLLDEVTVYRQRSDQRAEADALIRLGHLAFDTGQFDTARQDYRKSMALLRLLNDQPGMVQLYARLGAVCLALEDYERGWNYYREGLAVAQTLQATAAQLALLKGTATLLIAANRKALAMELLAIILNHPESDEVLADDAERESFELEAQLPVDAVEVAWERGKTSSLEAIVTGLLNAPF